MKTVQRIFVCALLASLTAVAWSTFVVVRAIPAQIEATRAALLGEADAARRDFNQQLRRLTDRSDRQMTALRVETLAEVDQFRQTADRRIGDTLARADSAVDTLRAVRGDLKPALDNSAALTAQVNAALPLFLDCDHNPDCVFNRYVGASKSIERAAANFSQTTTDVRNAVPQMLATWNQIGVGVAGTASNLDRLTKPHWYDRLIGYGLNGVVIYRNLNPVTNLTVKGAQLLTARP